MIRGASRLVSGESNVDTRSVAVKGGKRQARSQRTC
jgi:hypothetical protein